MKFNKWTLGLAAVGVVSLASAARADEKINSLQTALSNTTISGYVSASANWAVSPGGALNANSPAGDIPFQGADTSDNKQDGFNLDVVKLSISKPEDESPWASGYQVDLYFGPDATGYYPSANSAGDSDFSIKQAYVTLRTPVGNGIDWKIGVFDTIIGYEVTDAAGDPNYTRSWGWDIEPTEHTGILGTYKINDQWSVSAGVADTLYGGINSRDDESGFGNGAGSYWHKTYMGAVTYTAPSSWGWAAGSSVYAGIVYGFANSDYGDGHQVNYYFGTTMNTPWSKLTTGLAFDYAAYGENEDTYVLGAYATYKATDKLSLNGRAEYIHNDYPTAQYDGYELTGTVEYDLWANVITRVEARFDHDNYYEGPGYTPDAFGLYANVIYKF